MDVLIGGFDLLIEEEAIKVVIFALNLMKLSHLTSLEKIVYFSTIQNGTVNKYGSQRIGLPRGKRMHGGWARARRAKGKINIHAAQWMKWYES